MSCRTLIGAGALTLLTGTLYAQIQVGTDIEGEAADDRSGYAVSLSTDGSRLAISAPQNDGNGTDSGHVRVYQRSGTIWTQLGADIDGEAAEDRSGESVSLSADGNRLAIGAPLNDGNGESSGHARVYEWSGSTWTQLGADIDDEDSQDWSGISVSLSDDGSVLAVGSIDYTYVGFYSGHVRVFQWSGTAWMQLGADIDGEHREDNFGFAVSLSADGSRLAVGALRNDGNGLSSGHVRIYQWSGASWTQLGADIDGEARDDIFGEAVSLSADGNRLAIGAPQNDGISGIDSGHARAYQWSGASWTQLGDDIDGEAGNDRNGVSVSLSADGSRLAVGAPHNDGNGQSSGHARVYQWSGSAWTQFSADIEGEAVDDWLGISVSLSADGNWLASGAIYNDGNGVDSGHVRVYTFAEELNQMAFNGLFYDPANSGHGFDFNMHTHGLTIYYYGHTADGERLWLISGTHTDPIAYNEPFELSLYEVVNGTFGNPILPESLWGTLSVTMTSCDIGSAMLNGLDGNIDMEIVRLVSLAGMDCSLAP